MNPHRIITFLAASIAVTLLSLETGCSTIDMSRASSAGLKAIQAATVSDEFVEQYVKEFVTASDQENTIATGNDPYAVRLNRIAGAINNRDGINIKVYKKEDVNAFAVADGSVRVYSGLMDIMSDEEVLGVIGHEIGHVKLKHSKEAFKRALLTSALRDGISATGGTAQALSDSQLGDLGEAFLQSQYSQKQEFAADDYGYQFLKDHGINPWAMALSFEKLQQLQQQAGPTTSSGLQQLFSTHPDIVARTARMAERATKDGYTRSGAASGGKTTGSGAVTSPQWSF